MKKKKKAGPMDGSYPCHSGLLPAVPYLPDVQPAAAVGVQRGKRAPSRWNISRSFSAKAITFPHCGIRSRYLWWPQSSRWSSACPLAYVYNMYYIKGRGFLQIIIILCSMSAPFIGAYSWILLLGNSGLIRKAIKSLLGITLPSIYGFNGILLVLSLQLFPLVFLYVSGAMKNIDNSLLEASENMGCKGVRRFFKVILPLCMPTILAATLLVFMRAFADFGTPLLIGQGYRTFPVEIYNAFFSETAGGDYGFACATSVIAILITTVVFLCAEAYVQ